MNMDVRKKLSVRGRVAFAIACFERAVCGLDTVTLPIKQLIDYLWEFTSTNDLNSWDKNLKTMIYSDNSDEKNYELFKEKYLRKDLSNYDAKYLYEVLGRVVDVALVSMNKPFNSDDTINALKVLEDRIEDYDISNENSTGYYDEYDMPGEIRFEKASIDEPNQDGKIDGWGQLIKRDAFDLKPVVNEHSKCEKYIYKVSDYIDEHSEEWQSIVREKKYYNECLDFINLNIFGGVPRSKIVQWRKDACDFEHYDQQKLKQHRIEFHELVWKNQAHPFDDPGSKDFNYKYEIYSAICSLLSDDSFAVSGDTCIEYFSLDMIHLFKVDEDIIEGLLKKYFGDVVKD